MRTSKAWAFGAGLLAASALAETPSPGPSAQFPAAFPAPTSTTKPWTRWWWMGSAVDQKGIDRMLSQFAQEGEGGVEICAIYGAKGYESRFLKYLSPEWIGMVAHTTEEAKKLGIGVDLTTGTGWPMGGPWISKELASEGLILKKGDAGGGVYSVHVKQAVQRVKRAAPGGEGYVINPFSILSLDAYLQGIDKAFVGYAGLAPRAQFHDSYEYYDANWTPDFPEQFGKRRGYSLYDHIDALAGVGEPDLVARVRHDYRLTLAELHLEWVAHWSAWTHEHGSLSREQAHGAPANLEDVYAAADIPETEGDFGGGTDAQIPMLKFASSAAHAKGTKLASSETFTWLGEHFNVSLADMKEVVDRFYLSGINHIFFHGTPYSPDDAPWPGWVFYASVNFGPTGGLWHDLPAFNAYATRCQSILQSGRPDEDVLLYFPFDDFIQVPAKPAGDADPILLQFKTPGLWLQGSDYYSAAMQLWSTGYAYDSVTDAFLEKAAVEKGMIVLGGNHYQAIAVPACHFMPVETLRRLAELSKSGGKILFLGDVPQDVPGFGEVPQRREALRALGAELTRSGMAPIHAGADLSKSGLRREPMADLGLHCVRRIDASGDVSYFIVNDGGKPVEGWVPLASEGTYAELLDPLNGGPSYAAAFRVTAGHPEVYLQLGKGQSIFVVLRREFLVNKDIQEKSHLWPYRGPTNAAAVAIAGPWAVHFLEGGPVLPADFKTEGPHDWTEQPDPEAARFAGTARYSATVTVDPQKASDWLLMLPGLADSAQVRVNGTFVGTVWTRPFQIAVGTFLHSGSNRIEIDVTNVAANRIRDLDRRHVSWKSFYEINFVNRDYKSFDASNWPIRPAGLSGEVNLVPVTYVRPSQ